MEQKGNGPMGRIIVDIVVANNVDLSLAGCGMMPPEKVRRTQLQGVIDSGASYLVLPEKIVQELGLPAAGEASVRYADHRMETRQLVSQADVELAGRHGLFKAIVEPSRTEALIGAIVLEDLDLLVDRRSQKVHPRDPERIIAEIE